MSTRKFHEIFALEADAINQRRAKNNRPAMALEQEDCERDGTPVMRPTPASGVIGLALSGGGIRSAAFCLGAMQALDVRGLIPKLDYLSTVSGGGYIGTSMTSAMSVGSSGKFPFTSELRTEEVAGVEHIRDHSNYLFPQGGLNVFSNIVVYLRGIVANVVLLLPWLLLAAALTIWLNPKGTETGPAFGLTLYLLLAFFIALALWSLWRSTHLGRNISDVGFGARSFGIGLVAILAVAFLELQPWVLSKIVAHASDDGGGFATVSAWLKAVAGFGTVVGFLGRFLADILKRLTEKPGFAAFASRIAIKFAMYVAGAAVPLLLWAAYLKLSFWGVDNSHDAPGWLITLAGFKPFAGSIARLYGVTGLVLLFISGWLSANANSLHRLYRDRLSKAFLFDPDKRIAPSPWYRSGRQAGAESAAALRGSDLLPLDGLRVSELNTELAPYHLINAALNIEASKYANRRGRNADFFIFSPLFTGSEAARYVSTELMEHTSIGLTAGTAMAVSGAAASSNMGSATIKPLVPTLAILNVRLGYWLSNPGKVAGALKKALIWRLFDRLYFLKELLGLLSEDSETIYLTDGGHLENLGLYELLRRRCKLIIAVDGEADPDLSFGSLVTLERYARIDFSVRIDLPWAALRDVSREASEDVLKSGGLPPEKAPHGPHCALGTIHYPRKAGETDDTNSTGLLLYIKASFTGDENDYVVDYKRRNPSFPHETTLDQLFTEEQFEAYRALGFHAVNSAFKGVDKVSMNPDPVIWEGTTSTIPLEARMRAILA
jgi:hypothetical protein